MERYLRVNLLGPGPRLIKNNLPGRGLTKVQKHWSRSCMAGSRIPLQKSTSERQNVSDRFTKSTVVNVLQVVPTLHPPALEYLGFPRRYHSA